MADYITAGRDTDKCFIHTGFTTTISNSIDYTSAGPSDSLLRGHAWDLTDTLVSGDSNNKIYKVSSQFTTTVKDSFGVGGAIRGISHDATNVLAVFEQTTSNLITYSGIISSTAKSTISVADNGPTGVSTDGIDTFVADITTDKLYKLSGVGATDTVKVSIDHTAVDTVPFGIGWDGTDVPWSGSQANKYYKQSGVLTSTLKTSISSETGEGSPHSIDTIDTNTRLGISSGTTYEDSIALAKSLGLTIAADVSVEAAISAGADLGASFSAQVSAETALSFGNTLNISLVGGLDLSESISLDKILDISLDNDVSFEEALSLSITKDIIFSPDVSAEAAISLSETEDFSYTANVSAEEALTFSKTLDISFVDELVANIFEEAISLGEQHDAVYTALVSVEANITASGVFGVSLAADVSVEAAISIAKQCGVSFLDGFTYEEAVAIAMQLETLASAALGAPFVLVSGMYDIGSLRDDKVDSGAYGILLTDRSNGLTYLIDREPDAGNVRMVQIDYTRGLKVKVYDANDGPTVNNIRLYSEGGTLKTETITGQVVRSAPVNNLTVTTVYELQFVNGTLTWVAV